MTQFSDEIKKLIDNTPNDQKLGEKIRQIYWEEKETEVPQDAWRKGTLWEKET
jgi:hypothetical protein